MSTPDEDGPPQVQETAGLRPESAGGAGMTQEGAPIGFTAEVGGSPAPTTDDPDQVAHVVPEAAESGPTTTAERAGDDDGDDDAAEPGTS